MVSYGSMINIFVVTSKYLPLNFLIAGRLRFFLLFLVMLLLLLLLLLILRLENTQSISKVRALSNSRLPGLTAPEPRGAVSSI